MHRGFRIIQYWSMRRSFVQAGRASCLSRRNPPRRAQGLPLVRPRRPRLRSFYRLRSTGEPPATWRHDERDPSDGTTEPIPLEFFWSRRPDGVPTLVADHDHLLPVLIELLMADGLIERTATGG